MNNRFKKILAISLVVGSLAGLATQTHARNTTDTVLGSPAQVPRAHDVPSGNAGRFYMPGAAASADNIFPSSYSNTFRLDARFKAGFNMSCGQMNFYQNFQAELQRLKYKMKNTIKRAQKAIIASVSSSMSSFFQYLLMKINPSLAQLSIKQLDEYIKMFDLKVKSCKAMEKDIAAGKNPLSEIVQIAVGDQWKKTIGQVKSGAISLEEAEEEIVEEAKKSGVDMADGKKYGGENQPPINITKSLITAGMNLIMGRGDKSSWDSNFNTNAEARKNNPILKEFKSPKELYTFVEDVYGSINRKITDKTPSGESVKSVAGRGYEKKYAQYRDEFIVSLRKYVDRQIDRQTFIEKTSYIIPPIEIEDLRQTPGYARSVAIEERGQRYAAKRIKDNITFAKQALKTGIYAPDMQQSSMKGVSMKEYKDLYYRMLDDITEVGQRIAQY